MDSTESYCEVHKNVKNTFYCTEQGCDKLICPFCIKNHKKHKFMDGIEFGEEICQKLQKQYDSSNKEKKLLDDYFKDLNDLSEFLIKRREHLIKDAEQKSKVIEDQVNEYKKDIMLTTNKYLASINSLGRKCSK